MSVKFSAKVYIQADQSGLPPLAIHPRDIRSAHLDKVAVLPGKGGASGSVNLKLSFVFVRALKFPCIEYIRSYFK